MRRSGVRFPSAPPPPPHLSRLETDDGPSGSPHDLGLPGAPLGPADRTEQHPHLHDLAATLARRGIVSAVAATADVEPLRAALREHGSERYILDACAPPGSGTSLGQNMVALVTALRLRPGRVLLVSNDINAIRQAMEITPSLQFAEEDLLGEDMLADPRLQGEDPDLHQLSRMRTMLARTEAGPPDAGSHPAPDSGLRLHLDWDVASHLDEAMAVIHDAPAIWSALPRPRQWKGTQDALRELLEGRDTVAALVRLRDRFGDYGPMGLCVTAGRRVRLFCVAAQSAGTGLAGWLYAASGRPPLPTSPDAEQALAAEPVPTLTLDDPFEPGGRPARYVPALRVRGGRPAEILAQFLRPVAGDTLLESMPQRGGHIALRLDHTAMLPLALAPRPQVQKALDGLHGATVPLRTALFDPASSGTVLVLLPFGDADVPVYHHTALDIGVPLVLPPLRGTDVREAPLAKVPAKLLKPVEAALVHLREHFGAATLQDPATSEAILRDAFAHVPPDCVLYVVLAPVPNGSKAERVATLNNAIAAAALNAPRVRLFDPAEAPARDDDVSVWHELARRIVEECGQEAPAVAPTDLLHETSEGRQAPEPAAPATPTVSAGSPLPPLFTTSADAAPAPPTPPRRSFLSRLFGR